jgi:hypothetical protein
MGMNAGRGGRMSVTLEALSTSLSSGGGTGRRELTATRQAKHLHVRTRPFDAELSPPHR